MIVAILQARLSSSRLPRKVLKPVLGKPMLELEIERIRRSRLIDKLVVATTTEPIDKSIELLCTRLEVDCFRGSLDNVLDRYYRSAVNSKADQVVRLTGDCPLIDPQIIDQVIMLHCETGSDYTSNVLPPTFPDGLDVEVMTFSALETSWKEARLPSEKEHVTSYIENHPQKFRISNVSAKSDFSNHRWTVDEVEDFELISHLFEALYPSNPEFSMEDVLHYLDTHPRVAQLNNGIQRNEGMQSSLQKDQSYLQREKADV
jgi:spore coat polysaccharide biosynthesis protein SpsF